MNFTLYSCCALLASSADASTFGVPSTSHPRGADASSSSIIRRQPRGGGGTRDDDASSPAAVVVAPPVPPAHRPYLPYALSIRDSIMIAHSFHGHPSFGPAGGLHGATYTVDVEFACRELHPVCNWVIDIGYASEMVSGVLERYNYRNLDELYGDGVMTTTEFMCRAIFDGIVEKLKEGRRGEGDGGGQVDRGSEFDGWINVTLWESHRAWASFEGPLI